MEREQRIKTLASKIRSDGKFSDELANKVDRMGKEDRETVIAAVVVNGMCESRLVRAIRSEFGAASPMREGIVKLDEFESEYEQSNGLKKV